MALRRDLERTLRVVATSHRCLWSRIVPQRREQITLEMPTDPSYTEFDALLSISHSKSVFKRDRTSVLLFTQTADMQAVLIGSHLTYAEK